MNKILYIAILFGIFSNTSTGQTTFSFIGDYGFEASQGYTVTELDSTYGTFGFYVRDWNDNNYGLYYAEFSKIDGSLIKKLFIHDDTLWSDFVNNNFILNYNAQLKTVLLPINDPRKKHENYLSIVSVDKNDSLYINDIINQDTLVNFSYLSEVIEVENKMVISSAINYSNNGNSQLCLTFVIDEKNYSHLLLGDTSISYNGGGPLLLKSDGNILLTMISTKISNAKPFITFYEIDSFKTILNQYTTSNDYTYFTLVRMIIANNDIIAFSSYKRKLVDFQTESIPVIVFYDYKKAKVIKTLDFNNTIYNSWDAAYKNLKYAHDGNIIYGGEYTYYVPEKDQRNRDIVIGKIDKEGNELWRKRYTILEPVINDATFYHWLHDLEPTSDGNYICYGEVWGYTEEAGKPVNEAWLFKINENGDIVNIDTTTTTTWVEKSELPISIYPNPATDMIYINQNNVNDLTYDIYDLQGRKIKTFDSKDSFHSYMMDISNFEKGLYFIKIIKDNKKAGILRFEKI